MMFPHEKREARTHGHSPGNGITPKRLSHHPLATEGEATPGPDDHNPYDLELYNNTRVTDPTANPDPYAFDDVAGEVGDLELPLFDTLGRGPRF